MLLITRPLKNNNRIREIGLQQQHHELTPGWVFKVVSKVVQAPTYNTMHLSETSRFMFDILNHFTLENNIP